MEERGGKLISLNVRWAAAGLAAVVLTVIIAWVLFVPAADWLAQHDIGHATGSNLETARNNARGNLLALTAGVVAAGALFFTARNFALQQRALKLTQRASEENAELARRTLELTQQGQQRTHELTEQGQVTERYTKAIEQLGSDKLDIRIGGIYALERIARDSARDHPTIMEVLATFIREHSPANKLSAEEEALDPQPLKADIQAALSVIGRRNPGNDIIRPINLQAANLAGADLIDANLAGANLRGAILVGASLIDANLNDVILAGASLNDANLAGADLSDANLDDADLGDANLDDANLAGTNLSYANLVGASLNDANLTHVSLVGTSLNHADLARATWRADELPVGWRQGAGGRLERDEKNSDA